MTISLVNHGNNTPTNARRTRALRLIFAFVLCGCNAPKEARPSSELRPDEPPRTEASSDAPQVVEPAPAPEVRPEPPTDTDREESPPEKKSEVPAAPRVEVGSSRPSSQEACTAKCRGVFARHGRAPQLSCNCRTTDAGKVCRDSSECQGTCLSDGSQKTVVEPGPPEKGFFLGKCAELVTTFGCYQMLPRGITSKGPYPLDEKPPTLCVD